MSYLLSILLLLGAVFVSTKAHNATDVRRAICWALIMACLVGAAIWFAFPAPLTTEQH